MPNIHTSPIIYTIHPGYPSLSTYVTHLMFPPLPLLSVGLRTDREGPLDPDVAQKPPEEKISRKKIN